MAKSERKLKHLSTDELFKLREQIRVATLGQDAASRRRLKNFLTYVDAELRLRRIVTEEATHNTEDTNG